ncbi:hypothetical protein ISG33_14465 [Glaciecola sp. MH2013]|uniref:DUF6881 domain-containing protein n=1 Tax=Glaciecola sp. MH2013 TaxID=2785524 RepID=UPI0018A00891|nr:hypothetical protein [Glaciecola sp. MH2013]MBF7074606.1 hypothetical protein [Glaciecola sp. MH2013]
MRYIDVLWIHDFNEEPYRLISEIGEDDYEIRKIEFFRDGKIGFATTQNHSDNTRLGVAEVPHLDEINSENEFDGKNISKQEFEALWVDCVG